MRSLIPATLILAATLLPAVAQPAVAQPAGVRPKPVTTIAVPPATQTPLDTIKALSQGAREAIQSDLAWVGKYNGLINGEASERLVTAIKAFQTDLTEFLGDKGVTREELERTVNGSVRELPGSFET